MTIATQTYIVNPAPDGVRRFIDPQGLFGVAPTFAAPIVNTSYAAEQFVANGAIWSFTPSLINSVPFFNWSLDCHLDEMKINPLTGEVTFDTSTLPIIEGVQPNQSTYCQILCSNAAGKSEKINILVHIGKTPSQIKHMGPGEIYTDLTAAMAAMDAGDILVVRAGTYQGQINTVWSDGGVTNNVPPGSALNPTIMMSDVPGKWIIDGESVRGCYVAVGSYVNPDWPNDSGGIHASYPQNNIWVLGLQTKNSTQEDGFTHAERTMFRWCIFGDTHSYSGTHNVSNTGMDRMQRALVEQSFVHGYGRYKFSAYQSSEVTFRRNYTRYDTYYGVEPSVCGYSFYRARRCFAQNNWVADSLSAEWHIVDIATSLTEAFQIASTNANDFPQGNKFQRNGTINVWNGGFHNYGNAVLLADALVVEDFVSVNQAIQPHPTGVSLITARGPINGSRIGFYNADLSNNGTSVAVIGERQIQLNNSLFDIKNAGTDKFIDTWGGGAEDIGIIDVVSFAGFTNDILSLVADGTVTNRNDLYVTAANGLMYPTRLEEGGVAESAGLGPTNIDKCIGRQGTQYGDPDHEMETQIPSLPIQMEEEAMEVWRGYTWTGPNQTVGLGGSATYSGDRGVAQIGDSPSYNILASMGHAVFPLNVGAVSATATSVRMSWDIPAANYHAVLIAFDIFYRNVTDSGSWVRFAGVDRLTNSLIVDGLTTAKDYEFYVKSRHVNGTLSGPSYKVSVAL